MPRGCLLRLTIQLTIINEDLTMKVFEDEKDKLLDHNYDGIHELDNHMPVWWLWLFYFTIAFGIGYLLYYQVFGWGPDQYEEYEQEMTAAEAKYGTPEEQEPAENITWAFSKDEEDITNGKTLFHSTSQLCFTCHGDNAQGLVGPNLTDEYWLHGCQPQDIASSIIHGYPEMGMLPYGSGAKLTNEQLESLISYIASLQGSKPENAKETDMSRAQLCTEGPLASSGS